MLAVPVQRVSEPLATLMFVHNMFPDNLNPRTGLGSGNLLCRLASARRSKKNAARNLRSVIHKAGVTMPVEIDFVRTTIKIRKPKVKIEMVYWPILRMSSWIEVLMNMYPQFLLGGYKWEEEESWRSLLTWFWNMYRECNPAHPIFSEDTDLSLAIPYMLHGDEGKGVRGGLLMVQSWQTVLSHLGRWTTNNSGRLT